MNTYYICIGLLLLLLVSLGFLVSYGRWKFDTIIGYTPQPEDTLYKWVRAHANTAEYVPAIMVAIYILSHNASNPAWVWWCVALITVSRYVFAAGMVFPKSLAKPNPLRFVGAMGTYTCGIALAVAILLQACNKI